MANEAILKVGIEDALIGDEHSGWTLGRHIRQKICIPKKVRNSPAICCCLPD
uniref:Uncharacterized protein n=1 Tax=Lilium longiflorum TaxID=4690 RepID=F8UMB2_LILLO|nr:hypothetical protein [Lilium longiflorum]